MKVPLVVCTIAELVPPVVIEDMKRVSLSWLIATQFSPEADNPHIEEDIMCCGKFKRCPLGIAKKMFHEQQDFPEVSYPGTILEGEVSLDVAVV